MAMKYRFAYILFMNQFLTLFSISIASLVGLVGCGSEDSDDGKIRIVATTTMIGDMADAIVGDIENVEVITLMGPGVDPHTYNLPPRSLTDLRKADVVLYNGLHLEGRTAEIYDPLREKGAVVLAVGDAVAKEDQIEGDVPGHPDPHVWGDPELWAGVIGSVTDAISEKLPDEAKILEANAASYRQQLLDLDAWAQRRVGELPEDGRVVITSHDAFNYFGRAYKLEVLAPQGISTEGEVGMADIAETAKLIRERSVKAIFTESSVNPATIERLASDTGVKTGGELYSDALGPAGKMEEFGGESYDIGTYVGMIKHNVNTIVEALK